MSLPVMPDLVEMARHIAVLNDDYSKLAIEMAVMRERLDWIYKILWVIITTSIGAFMANIWQIFILHKRK